MTKSIAWLIALAVMFPLVAKATPSLQKPVCGVVQSVDQETHQITVVSDSEDKATPQGFALIEGRTHLRRGREKVSFDQIKPGQAIHLYYKTELGRPVVIDATIIEADPSKH